MNQEVAIGRLKRKREEIKELLAEMEGDALKFPKIAEVLQKLIANADVLVQTLADKSVITGPELDITSQFEVLKKGLKRVRLAAKRMRKIADDVVCDIEESLGEICSKHKKNTNSALTEESSLPKADDVSGEQPAGEQSK